jgi:hypothetical protein
MTITENQAKDIFKYIASTLGCNDVRIFNNSLMMKDIYTGLWLSVFLLHENRIYHPAFEYDYVSMLNKIIKFKYLVVKDEVYKIPRSLEEFFIEMDLNI